MTAEMMLLGGERVPAADGARRSRSSSPATGAPMAEVAQGAPRTPRAPSTSPSKAFEEGPWPRTPRAGAGAC